MSILVFRVKSNLGFYVVEEGREGKTEKKWKWQAELHSLYYREINEVSCGAAN